MSGPPRRSPAAAYLASRTRFGIKFGLETIQALMEALGRPQVAFPTLLVAGTNGKGSVAAYADAGLRAAGLRCGRYTSPHLVRVNERITVGGEDIAPEHNSTTVISNPTLDTGGPLESTLGKSERRNCVSTNRWIHSLTNTPRRT